MDGRLEQLESRLAELEAQNRLLEKQRAEIEKALVDEKWGKRRTTLCADLFVFKLIDTLSGMEKRYTPSSVTWRPVRKPIPSCKRLGRPRRLGRMPQRASSAWSTKRVKA